MNLRSLWRWCPAVVLGTLAACGKDTSAPVIGPPAHVDAVSSLSSTAIVGATVAGVTVKVTDTDGHALGGVSVGFNVTMGNGTIAPRIAVTDSSGKATAAWTLGTVIGTNQVTATVTGIASAVTFTAAGTSGPVASLLVNPVTARLQSGVDSLRITVQSLDTFGNVTSPGPTFIVRDPSLVSIDAAGWIHAIKRGASTYIVATAGAKIDSVLVTVLATGQSLCTGVASPIDLAVGQVVTDLTTQNVCIHSSVAGAEYAIIPYFNASVAGTTTNIDVRGQGVVAPAAATTSINAASFSFLKSQEPVLVPDDAAESRLRDRERAEAPAYVAGARKWYAARRGASRGAAAAATAPLPAIGDLLKLNANGINFCDTPDIRTGRVVAITDKAIVVADTANPSGGFTDDEYRSFGVVFDTLNDPVDRAAFGNPTDIDGNGHVIMFFTRAVNELTASGASSFYLGFFYQRDLFPKLPAPPVTFVTCPASNVAEMFYLLVPDPDGVVNGNKHSKAQVATITSGTVAHEYQHLINASRRMYVNGAGTTTEEKWLDEGLAHIAEELNFFKASGRSPRANIDASAFNDPNFVAAYSTYELNNFNRYKTYLAKTELQGPISSDPGDDDLQTRGAIWSFLRYAADQRAASNEGSFWFNLVNSLTTGTANLATVLGSPPNTLMRDWATSVFVDDNATAAPARFTQPTWNVRSLFTSGGGLPFPLTTRTLVDNLPVSFPVAANGVGFLRFGVPANAEALLTVTSGNQPAPATILVSVVRVK